MPKGEKTKSLWNNPEYRKKQSTRLRQIWNKPGYREYIIKISSGENSSQWKGGKPKCINCSKEIRYGCIRCKSCYLKSIKGSNHPSWKGGKRKRKDGYIMIYMPKHPFAYEKYVYEHRFIIEQQIKRYLKIKETPHHINHVVTDNRPENLMALSSHSAHMRFEHGRKVKPKEIIFDGRKIIFHI
jgi:hypothetical protein